MDQPKHQRTSLALIQVPVPQEFRGDADGGTEWEQILLISSLGPLASLVSLSFTPSHRCGNLYGSGPAQTTKLELSNVHCTCTSIHSRIMPWGIHLYPSQFHCNGSVHPGELPRRELLYQMLSRFFHNRLFSCSFCI